MNRYEEKLIRALDLVREARWMHLNWAVACATPRTDLADARMVQLHLRRAEGMASACAARLR